MRPLEQALNVQLRAVKRRDANDAPTCTYVRPSAMTRNWSNILLSPSRNRPLEGEFFELSYKISISARNVFISTNIYHRIFNIVYHSIFRPKFRGLKR